MGIVLRVYVVALGTVILAALLNTGCSEIEPGAPIISAIEPATAPQSEVVQVTISGSDLFKVIRLNLDNESASPSEVQFSASLQLGASPPVTLENVEWVDQRHLRASVPAETPVGTYDLIVVGRWGASDTLLDAFTVCDDQDGDGNCHCTDGDRDGFGQPGTDQSGCAHTGDDCDDRLNSIFPGAMEVPDDTIDQDCNDADTITCFVDSDMDGFGSAGTTVLADDGSCDTSQRESTLATDCNDEASGCIADCLDEDGDGTPVCAGDCDDSVSTGATCSSGCTIFFADTDSDTFGNTASPSALSCVAPIAHVADNSDCDDATNSCTTDCTDADGDGLARCAGDCDDGGITGVACTVGCNEFFLDSDLDGFGDAANSTGSRCFGLTGEVANDADCDDTLASCTTDCTDDDNDDVAVCAGDCDDSVSTGATCSSGCTTFFADTDGDSFGLSSSSVDTCVAPVGFVSNSQDCADASPVDALCGGLDGSFCSPGETEGPAGDATCSDGLDNDCNGLADSADPECPSAGFGYTTSNVDSANFTPSGAVDLTACTTPVTFNSSTLAFSANWCGPEPTPQVVDAGGIDVVVLPMDEFTLPAGITLQLLGARPVVALVYGSAAISGVIDASATGTTAGPGGSLPVCVGGSGQQGESGADRAGGGGGAGFGAAGGIGGTGDIGARFGGPAGTSEGSLALTPLRGGCTGGDGGVPDGGGSGPGGSGGGALQLSVADGLLVSGTIVVGGGGGGGGDPRRVGGGGGGSGGAILLEAGTVTVSGGLFANGGAGGGGAGSSPGTAVTNGEDGSVGLVAAIGGLGVLQGGEGDGGDGGDGGVAPGNTGTPGANAEVNGAGGGGGGGVGRIRLNANISCQTSLITVSPQPTSNGASGCP